MPAALRDHERLKRTPVSVPIAMSCHIKCHRSFHQGIFNHLAGHGRPIIFNNSCSSSHELAAGFLGGGARCYIATLWRVGNETATKAASIFYDSALADGTVLTAFCAMLRSIRNDRYQDIYILWGLHFTSLVRPVTKSDEYVIAGLVANHAVWMRKFTTAKDDELKRNIVPILRFLRSEILRRVTPGRQKQILAESIVDEDHMERYKTLGEEREVNELILTKEVDSP